MVLTTKRASLSRRETAVVVSIVLSSLGAACDDGASVRGDGDASTLDAVDVGGFDVGLDHTSHDRPIGSPCEQDGDCADSAFCWSARDGIPNGVCTRSCTADVDCPAAAVCNSASLGLVCTRTCATSADCGDANVCAPTLADPGRAVCQPFCDADSQCPSVGCNRNTRLCERARATGLDGDACGHDSDCRGLCASEIEGIAFGGFIDGDCYSRCRVPDRSAYDGAALPTGGCDPGSVCVREGMVSVPDVYGDAGRCERACRFDTDCRAGYGCVHPPRLDGGGMYDNGFCAPIDCADPTRPCPDGFVCVLEPVLDVGAMHGHCMRSFGGGMLDASTVQ
jgi:hypothetical protein